MRNAARLILCIGMSSATFVFAPRVASARTIDDPSIFDCRDIDLYQVDQQENLLASQKMIACGRAAPGNPDVAENDGPFTDDYGGTDIDIITGKETWPHMTHSESMVWGYGSTIVVQYNDSSEAPSCYAGISTSIDGGATFTRIQPSPLCTGHGRNFGDPIVVHNDALGLWFTGDIATGCGGAGFGLWTSPDGLNWDVGACAYNSSNGDRESMWVDNNPASPYYGRMYISLNDFARGQRIYVTYSDDGTTWSPGVQVTSGFIRNIQLTGSSESDGAVGIAGMDERGGGSTRVNWWYSSLDGGDTWTATPMGPEFPAPGERLCGYFWAIRPIWRHMGWGQPAYSPGGVVHYAYAGRGVNANDLGDIYYIRSEDNGATWSKAVVLNSDSAEGGTNAQWMPSVSATADGKVFVTWYDRRDSTDGTNYQYWGIQSTDNGLTWLADMPVSDALSPQPLQPDGAIQSCYAGDYNYASTVGTTHLVTWTDGRTLDKGRSHQNVYFDQVP